MTKLSDLHAVVLTHAAQGERGSLLPLPPSLASNPARAIRALVTRGLA
jgi:hypothetical protein